MTDSPDTQLQANHDTADHPGRSRPSSDGSAGSSARWAYPFYAVAVTGAVIGQTWVALEHLSWSPAVPVPARVLLVLPFALCLELLAMALAAMADERMRLGERAYSLRAFSAMVAAVAVGIQVAGHWPDLYWAAVFGVLSSSAYALWMLHAAARRRDALRAAGKLADTAPDYGLRRRIRHPILTARAAELAREGHRDATTGQRRPLALFESLRAAEQAISAEKRRPAVARAVAEVVRADQHDPRMADIAVRTLDLDRLAAELASRVNYCAWADRLAPAITAPTRPMTDGDTNRSDPAEASEPEQPHQPAAAPASDAANPYSEAQPVPKLDSHDHDHDHDGGDYGPDDGEEIDTDDGGLAPDLAPLLPAARVARDDLVREGRTVSRDALAHRLRRDGHAIRNNRVSELLNALRREEATRNGHLKVPV